MIKDIVKKNLCTQCGTCAGVCPNDNIKMVIGKNGEWFPEVGSNCSHCQKCINSCPGWEVDFNGLNKEIFGKLPKDVKIGNFKDCYIGFSKDKKIRMDSSSGGIVTSLGIYLLEKKLVKGVVVAVDSKDPLHPKPIIARTKRDMIKAMQSKYVSVPMNIMIKDILKEKGKFAFVGQPCQIHGLRKAEWTDKRIKEKIKYKIGIFCSHSANLDGIKFFLKRTGVKDFNEIKQIRYRNGNWPGVFEVILKNRTTHKLPFDYYYYPLLLPYYKKRCLKCIDLTNELADISIGDAWQLDLNSNEGGFAVIINRGIDINLEKVVEIKKILTEKEVIKTQRIMLDFKKDSLTQKKEKFKSFPDYKIEGLSEENGQFKKIYNLVKFLKVIKNFKILDYIPKSFLNTYLKRITKKTN
jgi:coenzyme F420 hydrogenase subunit beta